MKYAVLSLVLICILCLFIAGAYYIGRNGGKIACESEYNKKIAEYSQDKEKRFDELKNKITELNSKVRKIKNEECDTIRNYPLSSNCRK